MNNFFRVVLFSILVLPCWARSEIRESSTIKDMIKEASPHTLLVFDIDNTLMRPTQMLGSDEWFYHFYNKSMAESQNKEKTHRDVVSLWEAIYTLTNVRTLEPCATSVIQQLQDQGYMVMALTTRGYNFSHVTLRLLSSLGINMAKTAPTNANFQLQDLPSMHICNGVIFTNNQHKGQALLQFFKQISMKPKRIVFLDDKMRSLEQASLVENEGIEYLGLRYSVADTFVKSLDITIADIQFQDFLRLLSDNEALALAKKQTEQTEIASSETVSK